MEVVVSAEESDSESALVMKSSSHGGTVRNAKVVQS